MTAGIGTSAPSPVAGTVRLVRRDGPGSAVTELVVDADEPVFAGHYPGFPIFPGVCIVECVRLSAELAPVMPELGLVAVESTRFEDAVYPGDTLTTELTWVADGDAWRCRARVRTERGPAAGVRLRYERTGESDAGRRPDR